MDLLISIIVTLVVGIIILLVIGIVLDLTVFHRVFGPIMPNKDKKPSREFIEKTQTNKKITSSAYKDPDVAISVNPDEKEVVVSKEVILVLPGGNTTVKRSRTIKHAINIEWDTSVEGSLDAGFKQILSVSIKAHIGQIEGYSYQEIETTEHEVQLPGANSTSTRYTLAWIDIWRSGEAEFQQRDVAQFQFRERSELRVIRKEMVDPEKF